MSVLHQLSSEEPLFKRAISMSGTPLMLKPLSPSAAEASYSSILQTLGLENASTEERIHRLLTISPNELVEKTPMTTPLTPFTDNDIVPHTTTFAELQNDNLNARSKTWCEELLTGSCTHDGNVFFFMGLSSLLPNIAAAIAASFSRSLSEPVAQAVLTAYSISSSTPDDEAMDSIINLATDIAYRFPAEYFARAFRGRSWTYAFTEENPWEGMFKGKSTHMLDAAFLFQNFNEHLDGEAKGTAAKLAEDFVMFANGKAGELWDEGVKRVYGKEVGKESKLQKLVEEGKVDLDDLSRAWGLFLAGK